MVDAPAEVREVDWSTLTREMRWRQDEHVALIGPTRCGKTTLLLSLVEARGHVLLTSTKAVDSTLRGLKRQGWTSIARWPAPATVRRVVLHAPLIDLRTDGPKVGATIAEGLQGAYRAGGWCIALDDLQALNTTCNLSRLTSMLLLNAASSNVAVVASTQRPRWVPREVWTQSTHLFIWRCNEREDLRALSGLGAADAAQVRAAVQSLQWGPKTGAYQCLYVNTRTGDLAVTQPPAKANPS